MFEGYRRKKLTVRLAICLFAIALFYAAVCTPIARFVASDVLLANTVLPSVIDIVILFFNYSFYWISFGFLVYAIHRLGAKSCAPLFAVYGGAVVFRYLANQMADFCVFGFPSINDFFSDYLPYSLLDMLLDVIQMTLAVLLTHHIQRISKEMQRDALKELPLTGLFDLKKYISRNALFVAMIPAAFKLISRLIYDAWYGAPRGLGELLWMIVSYFSDIACIMIGYAVIVLLLNRCRLDEIKAKNEYDRELL